MGGIGMSKDVSYKNRDRFLELGLAIAGISRSHLSAIEAPNIIRAFSVEVLYNLADALEIRPGELLDCDIYAYHDAGGTL